MEKIKVIRHGEILLIHTKDIPKEAKKKDTNVLAVGINSNSHSFKGGTFLEFKGQNSIFGYLRAKNTKLYHPEHSPEGVKIPNGNWEIRKGTEFTPAGLIPIAD